MNAHPVQANALDIPLADNSVQCIVTSPPYFGLRDYSESNQIGLEPTLQEYIANLVSVFDECWRVLRDDGVLWLNLGDSYAGSGGAGGDYNQGGLKEGQPRYHGTRKQMVKSFRRDKEDIPKQTGQIGFKPKDLMGVPWRVALALQDRGWWLRSAITWIKGNPMPESVRDRPTQASEMIFLFSKSTRYYWDADAVRGFSKSFNPSNANLKKGIVPSFTPPLSFSAQSRNIPSYSQLAPYFVLACLLGSKRISIKEGDDNLNQTFDFLKTPMANWPRLFARLKIPKDSANIFLNILENLEVIITQLNLQSEPEFWVSLSGALAESIVSIQATLSIKEARKVVSKLICNVQILWQTISFDSVLKGIVNVDVINQSITLFDCAEFLPSNFGDGLVAESINQKLCLLVENLVRDIAFVSVGHNGNYTTETPTTGRNILNWWYINTVSYPGSHFATFPPRLPEICIKAGTSEKGECPECGNPWKRLIEKELVPTKKAAKTFIYDDRDKLGHLQNDQGSNRQRDGHKSGWINKVTTLGWEPSCSHDHEPVSQTVLDPFGGSGTTAMVARNLGRVGICLDLSAKYLQLAQERLGITALADWQNGKKAKANWQDTPLFKEVTHES